MSNRQRYENREEYIDIPESAKTRPIVGCYELSAILTQLSKHIYEISELSSLIDNPGAIDNFINPADIAFRLIKEGKYDAILNRDAEDVVFSNLYTNKSLMDQLDMYFKKQDKIIKTAVLDGLGLTE